jgi:MFS transporter, DHA2 family, multidrug resistance protein
MDDAVTGMPTGAAEAASDSVGAAHEVAAQIGGAPGAKLVGVANHAFVDAMASTATIAAAAAMVGALIALAFLPSRAAAETPVLGADRLEPAPA